MRTISFVLLSIAIAGILASGGCATSPGKSFNGAARTDFNAISSPPLGPYSSAVRAGGFVFVSGVLAFDHAAKGFAASEIRAQTMTAFDNLEAALRSAGVGLDDVVKISVFLRSADDIGGMNAVYAERLAVRRPARTLVAGADWGRDDILIEIDAIAVCRCE